MLTANEIRDSFVKFFESKGHQIVPSAPMVIKDDPTLMFTNAGMNQFKDIILGNHPAKYKRVTDSQKCLRVSGKHNDLEEVGHDTYHHTMFEMLGNWSFGDYFKKEVIGWAWEYLVNVLKIDPSILYATVFEGSAEEGLERDNEAAGYWASTTTFGKWEIQDPADRVRKSISTCVRRKKKPKCPDVNWSIRTIRWSLKSGTSYSCNTTGKQTETWSLCQPR